MADIEATIAQSIATARADGRLEPAEAPVVPVVDENTPPVEESEVEEVVEGDEPVVEGEESTEKPTKVEEPKKEETVPVKDDKKKKEPKEEATSDDDDAPAKEVKGWIPKKEHIRVTRNREKKSFAKVAEALGLTDHSDWRKINPETFTTALTDHVADVKSMREEVSDYAKVKPVMVNEPDEFMKRLARINPEYAKFKRVDGATETKEVELPDEKDDPRPLPDMEIDLGGGKKGKTYSDEQHDKLMQYYERRGERKAEARMKKQLDERLGPIEIERKTKAEVEKDLEDRGATIKRVIGRFSKKKGWDENKAEIQEAVLKGKFKDLPFEDAVDAAYDEIVVGKLFQAKKVVDKADDEEEEIPESTSLSSRSGKKKVEDVVGEEEGDDRTTLTIKRSIAKARREGRIK